MAKHAEIMKKYSECLSAGFDQNNEEHIQLVSWNIFEYYDSRTEVTPFSIAICMKQTNILCRQLNCPNSCP